MWPTRRRADELVVMLEPTKADDDDDDDNDDDADGKHHGEGAGVAVGRIDNVVSRKGTVMTRGWQWRRMGLIVCGSVAGPCEQNDVLFPRGGLAIAAIIELTPALN